MIAVNKSKNLAEKRKKVVKHRLSPPFYEVQEKWFSMAVRGECTISSSLYFFLDFISNFFGDKESWSG